MKLLSQPIGGADIPVCLPTPYSATETCAKSCEGVPLHETDKNVCPTKTTILGVRLEVLDERHLVSGVVVRKTVHHSAGDKDAESTVAEAELIADLDVGDRVVLSGGVGELDRVEAGALVGDDEFQELVGHFIRDRYQQLFLTPIAPLGGVLDHFQSGVADVLDFI